MSADRGVRSGGLARRLALGAVLLGHGLLLGGCGYHLGITIGPTVDTFGRPGVDARLTAGVGAVVGRTMLGFEAGAGGGLLGRERTGAGDVHAGVSVSPMLEQVDLRFGLLYAARFFSAPQSTGRLDAVRVAILAQRMLRDLGAAGELSVGGELDAEYAAGDADRGIFLLGLHLELSSIQMPGTH